MDNANNTVTLEELRLFHKIDRSLYTILVKDLFRDPSECIQIMGLWMWMERRGFSNLVYKILPLPPFLINELADEAVACLMRLNNQFSRVTEIPLTRTLVNNEVSLQYFYDNRFTIPNRIHEIVTSVCIPGMSDIMEQALNGGFRDMPTRCQARAPPPQSGSLVHFFSSLSIEGESSSSSSGLIRASEVSRQERTMFVTFSKGYPVNEEEVKQFFGGRFGECLESFHMQDVMAGEQVLYAKMVFTRSSYISMILQGVNTAKFTINGKHVWMRRFVSRTARLMMIP